MIIPSAASATGDETSEGKRYGKCPVAPAFGPRGPRNGIYFPLTPSLARRGKKSNHSRRNGHKQIPHLLVAPDTSKYCGTSPS